MRVRARIGRPAAVASAVALMAACVGSGPPAPDIRVEEAWVRAVAGPDANTAAYLTIRNAGRVPDRLLGARSGIARMTELHRTTIDASGLARMGRVEDLDVPAGGTVTLEPGGHHFMLMGVSRSLPVGDSVRLVVRFEVTGTVDVAAEVRTH